jgi:acyl carrier protein
MPITENEKIEFLERSIQTLFNHDIKLNLNDNLHDLGIDSLDIVELQLFYEETFNAELPDTREPIVYVSDIIKLMT